MENKFVIEVSGVNRIFSVPGGEFQALKDINTRCPAEVLPFCGDVPDPVRPLS